MKVGVALLGFALALPGCRPQPDDAHLFFSDLPYPSPPAVSPDTAYLELVREYGDRDQGLVFGEIAAMAANSDGDLAVYDAHGCRIWIVDTGTGDWEAIGGCGDGPGEFKNVTAMSFSGDTLTAFDEGRLAIVRVTKSGEELTRFRLPKTELEALTIQSLTVNQDGTILAALELYPDGWTPPPTEHLLFALFEGTSGAVLNRGLTVPPFAMQGQGQMSRPAKHCSPAPDRLFVSNVWGPQVLFLKADEFRGLASLRIPISWVTMTEYQRRPGIFHPRIPHPEVACGEGFAVVGYRRLGGDAQGRRRFQEGAILVFDSEGSLMTSIREDGIPEPGSILYLSPGAGAGDRIFLFGNGFIEYPIVREYRLVRNGAAR